MSDSPSIARVQRSAPSVYRIRSPLTHVGFTLPTGSASAILVAAGVVRLRQGQQEPAHLGGAPRLLWRAGGAGEELIAEGGTRATVVTVPGPALANALPTTPIGEQMGRTLQQDFSFPFDPSSDVAALVEGLGRELSGSEPGADVAAAYYLSLLLVQFWRLARADLVAHGRAPQGLAERFVILAGKRSRDHLKVSDYARALGVSRDRLGTAVRRATGASPQAYLHQLLIKEASELLANTGMPVGQVAFRLGFPDPGYFSRFFTRLRGDSPARFRALARERRAAGAASYAAWP